MLTPQLKKFSQEYINKGDEKKAAIAAGVPAKSASKIGKDWIELPEVKRYINEEFEKSAERAQVTRDFVIDEVVKILRNTLNPVVKLQCTEQLRKLVLWRDSDGSTERTPEIHIHSDGGLTIL